MDSLIQPLTAATQNGTAGEKWKRGLLILGVLVFCIIIWSLISAYMHSQSNDVALVNSVSKQNGPASTAANNGVDINSNLTGQSLSQEGAKYTTLFTDYRIYHCNSATDVQYCVNQEAIKRLDTNICLKLSDSIQKDRCVYLYVLSTKDVDSCSLIASENLAKVCESS